MHNVNYDAMSQLQLYRIKSSSQERIANNSEHCRPDTAIFFWINSMNF